jgi:hypothetical protein
MVASELWVRHAKQWDHVSSPLRPCPQDIAFVQAEVDELGRASRYLHSLLLGTTPELINLRWPGEGTLIAVDASMAMLRRRRLPVGPMQVSAVCADWRALPVSCGQIDVALADGSLSMLYEQGMRQTLAQIAGSLSRHGRFIVRAFVRPEQRETTQQVCDDLLRGRIGSVHAAKWRLAMALHGSLGEGVLLDAVWRAFREAIPRNESLAARTGWSDEAINTVDAYRDVAERFFFPTLAELRTLLAGSFRELRCHIPTYELGSRCPTLVMAAR